MGMPGSVPADDGSHLVDLVEVVDAGAFADPLLLIDPVAFADPLGSASTARITSAQLEVDVERRHVRRTRFREGCPKQPALADSGQSRHRRPAQYVRPVTPCGVDESAELTEFVLLRWNFVVANLVKMAVGLHLVAALSASLYLIFHYTSLGERFGGEEIILEVGDSTLTVKDGEVYVTNGGSTKTLSGDTVYFNC